jgi:hypothetical protein
MIISSHIFETYLHCLSKIWLNCSGEKGESNIYSAFVEKKENAYLTAGIERLKNKVQGNECVVLSAAPENIKTASWRLAINVWVGET